MRVGSRDVSVLLLLGAICAGVVAIYLSSAFAQHFALREGPLPFRYPYASIGFFVATGVLLMLAVVLRPDLFWPLLIGTAITTGGMFVLGFPIFDEWLAGCLTLGAVVVVVRRSVPLRPDGLRRWWIWLFIVLTLYLFAEGVRGLLLYHNLKAVRPIVDTIVICAIAVLLARYEFPRLSSRGVTTIAAASGAAYLVLYMVHGILFAKMVFGRHLMEGIGGAEHAFATFPIAVAVPAAILLLRFDLGWRWLSGLCTIVLAVDVSFLSGSRAAILATVALLTVGSLWGGLRLAVQLWLSFLLSYAILVVGFHDDPMYAAYKAEGILSALHIPRGWATVLVFRGSAPGRTSVVALGDSNRHILNLAAISTVRSDPHLFLLGTGSYGYWPIAGRFVHELKAQYGLPDIVVNRGSTLGPGAAEPPRPPAWPVFIAETGMVGVLLILGNAAAGLRYALFRGPPLGTRFSLQLTPVVLAASLLGLLAWGYFAELQTKMLLYLMLMPYGVVHVWSFPEGTGCRRREMVEEFRVPENVAVA